MSLVLKEIRAHIGYLTLNNPKKLNALSNAMMNELIDGLKEFDEDERVRCVVLQGEGKAFSAGHDVNPQDNPYHEVQGWHDRAVLCNRVPFAIWNMRTPIIARIHRYCLGGACDIAAVCDLTIAADDTKFGEPEIQFNSHPPFPMLPYVLNYKMAKEVLLLGDQFSVEEALRMGLINKYVPLEELDKTVYEYAMKLVKMPVPAVRMTKQTINRIYEAAGFQTGIHIGEEAFAAVLSSTTPEFTKFCEIRDSEGMASAFKWRDEYFADSQREEM